MRSHLVHRAGNVNPSTGATLVEVLMSLLILAIGVVPIFTLFPVSLLSSIKANQLTTTRLFADQIASTIIANPELIYGAAGWQPDHTYGSSSIVTTAILAGNNAPTTRTYFATTGGGKSGLKEPTPWQTNPGAVTTDNGVTWMTWPLPTTKNTASYIPYRYVVDPYGVLMMETALKDDFGNDGGTSLTASRVLRINSGITDEGSALIAKFGLPDSWTTIETVVPTQVVTIDTGSDGVADSSQLTFPAGMDVSSYTPNFPNPINRVVAVSPDGRRSALGFVNAGPTTSTLQVSSVLLAGNTNPTDITSMIGQVRLEVFERRYTWLGAVQRSEGGGAHLQIAIFFNRSFRAIDEQIYPYTFPTGNMDTVNLTWSGSADPYVVKGGYAFDAGSVAFHRIIDVEKDLAGSSATLVVSPAIEQTNNQRRLIFMPGIVQVYEMDL